MAETGRYYRFDGKGDLTYEKIRAFDAGKEYENGYDRVNYVCSLIKKVH